MSYELPPPSDTSPICLKRRISVTNQDTNQEDCHEVQQPTLTLSPPSLTTLQAAFNGSQQTHLAVNGSQETHFSEDQFLNCSPKKPKRIDESENPSNVYVGTEFLHGGSGFESDKKNSILEDGMMERGNFSNLGVSSKNCSGKQSIKFGSWKKDKNSEISDPEIIECLEKQSIEFGLRSGPKFGECLEKKTKNLKGNGLTCSVKIEVIDETALVDVVKIDGKKKNDKKGNSTSIGGGRRKFVYSRKEMEALRFIKVEGQKKFWQEIYCGFAQTVKREYDELGNVRHQGARMRNYYGQDIRGMPAARGRWNYVNVFVC